MKRVIAVVLVFVLCFALTACGNDYSEPNIITGYKSGDVELPQYKGLTYKPLSTEVTDEEVQAKLDSFVSSYKTKVEVTDRDTVQNGDIVDIDFEGIRDGVAFDGGTGSQDGLVIGSGKFIPGFEESIIGHSIGSFPIDVTFPEVYNNNPDLAGVAVVFNITLKAIYEYKYPEVTDEFIAEKTSNKYATVSEYKDYLRNQIKAEKEEEAKSQKLYDLVLKLIETTKFNADLEPEIKKSLSNYKTYYDNLGASYGMDGSGYFRIVYGTTSEQYEEMLRNQAEYEVKFNYIKSAISEVEKFDATDEEVDELATSLMSTYGYTTKQAFYDVIKSTNGIEGEVFLREQVKINKAAQLILDTAIPE